MGERIQVDQFRVMVVRMFAVHSDDLRGSMLLEPLH
jgi:hypothetical protein